MSQESTDIPTDPVIEAVRADLLRRQQHGYVKYGGTLATNPAPMRDKLLHAYEEALDLANYLKWAIMEIDGYPELQPDPTHNTGHELTDAQRESLARNIQTWVENYDPKLLSNVSTGALQDELYRRQEAASCQQGEPCVDPVSCPDPEGCGHNGDPLVKEELRSRSLELGWCPAHQVYHRNYRCDKGYGCE